METRQGMIRKLETCILKGLSRVLEDDSIS